MDQKQGQPIIPFASRQEWEVWLHQHHRTSNGLWLKIAKKDAGIETVTYTEALESALCYGWIDGQRATFDDTFFLQRFTPRRPKSKWSKVNRAKVLDLIDAKRMQPAGLAVVEQAQRDGRWEQAYDPPSTASVPEDLQRALDMNAAAATFFATLNRTNRFAVLHRIDDAKRPETRARRIARFIAMLNRREKLYP